MARRVGILGAALEDGGAHRGIHVIDVDELEVANSRRLTRRARRTKAKA